mmetsp:Transcript_5194/g.16005  ORF Transcript_5194/g.16005 Transcript_5194/m.16005 type:complete len:267 (+) Transcript_5194:198-998(+)
MQSNGSEVVAGAGAGTGTGTGVSQPRCLFLQHQSFFSLGQECTQVCRPALQSKGGGVEGGAWGQPRWWFLQHQAFFSSTQDVCQLSRPMRQLKGSGARGGVVGQATCLWLQHHAFFTTDQPFTQLERPAWQSKGRELLLAGAADGGGGGGGGGFVVVRHPRPYLVQQNSFLGTVQAFTQLKYAFSQSKGSARLWATPGVGAGVLMTTWSTALASASSDSGLTLSSIRYMKPATTGTARSIRQCRRMRQPVYVTVVTRSQLPPPSPT